MSDKHDRRMELGAAILLSPFLALVAAVAGLMWVLGWIGQGIGARAGRLVHRAAVGAEPDPGTTEPTYREPACPHCGGRLR